MTKAIEREAVLVHQAFGTKTQNWINDKAHGWHHSTLIESGVYEAMRSHVIPTEEEKNASWGVETMGGGWFDYLDERLQTFSSLVYQLFTRLALLVLWLPYMLILVVPSIYDGIMTRNIKLTNFDYASPVMHRYSLRMFATLFIGMFIAFFSPIAISPIVIPIILIVASVLVGLFTANLQKRI